MGEIDRASEVCDVFPLSVELALHLCGARQLDVQSLAYVAKLVLDDGQNVGWRHRWTGGTPRSCSAPFAMFSPLTLCPTLSTGFSLQRHILHELYGRCTVAASRRILTAPERSGNDEIRCRFRVTIPPGVSRQSEPPRRRAVRR